MPRKDKSIKASELFEGTSIKESSFYKELQQSRPDMAKYQAIVKRLRDDTGGELTETEYDRLGVLQFFVDDIEAYMKQVGVENVPKELMAEYTKANRSLIEAMQDYRQKRTAKKDGLGDLKKAFLEYRNKNGGTTVVRIEAEPTNVIDLNVVLDGTGEGDRPLCGSGSVQDPETVCDEEGNPKQD